MQHGGKTKLYRTFDSTVQPPSSPYHRLLHSVLARYSESEARYMLRCLAEDVLQRPRVETEDQAARLSALVDRLLNGEPLQYVTGKAWFFKLPFAVNPSVLIPRPETEELVEWVLDTNSNGRLNLLDIGTGSGCIAIALKTMRPGWLIRASDVSEQALETARQNAVANKAAIEFIKEDITHVSSAVNAELDVIVSNPPYIARGEAATLEQNVKDFEPHLALFAPGDDALIFYKVICAFARNALKREGSVFVELNQVMAGDTFNVFIDYFRYVEMRRDLSGNYRMLMANGLK